MKNFFAKIKIRNVAIVVFAIALTLFSSCSNSQSEIAIITIDTGIQLPSRGITDVKSYRLTVSAADMKTVSETFTESKISLTLDEGKDRLFTLEALNQSGETLYEGSQKTDLVGGSEIEIVIKMNAVDTDTDTDTDLDEPVIPITILVDDFATFLTKPTLSWEQAENSSYKVRYAESKEALLTAEEIKCETNSYTFSEELSPGTYYWQCCSVVNEKVGDWSQAVSFTINDKDDGSSSYNIGYAYDLCFISENYNDLKSKNFKLIANIDMNNLQEEQQFAPISDFQATFDGNNKTISNLKIDSTSGYIGLFKFTHGAAIKDLTLKDIDISGTFEVGGIVGIAEKTNFSNCHVSGSITATGDYVGGLVGYAYGEIVENAIGEDEIQYVTIENCTSIVNINTKSSTIGGLVGYAICVKINNCYNTGIITGNTDVGGLVGNSKVSNIKNCYNTGIIDGYVQVGGLVGLAQVKTKIEFCNNSGVVKGNGDTGGLVGQLLNSEINRSYNDASITGGSTATGGLVGWSGLGDNDEETPSLITNCYNTGIITGNGQVGGLVGLAQVETKIEFCNNSGVVNGNGDTGGLVGQLLNSEISYSYNDASITGGTVATGGLVGDNDEGGSITNSYNMGDVKGISEVGGLVGRNYSNVSYCYVAAGVYETYPSSSIGALISDYIFGEIKDCYYDSDKYDYGEESNIGKTTIEMKEEKTYSGWDFDNIWGIDSNKNNGYPYLLNM